MADLDKHISQELDAMNANGRRTRKLRLTWTSALRTSEIGAYRVIPLTTSSALRREGAAMVNCVGSHDILCAIGAYRVFSIRDRDDQRVATLSLVLDEHGWHLDQIKGPSNTEVIYCEEAPANGEGPDTTPDFHDLYFVAHEILRQYRRQSS